MTTDLGVAGKDYCPVCCDNPCNCDEGEWAWGARDEIRRLHAEIKTLHQRNTILEDAIGEAKSDVGVLTIERDDAVRVALDWMRDVNLGEFDEDVVEVFFRALHRMETLANVTKKETP